MSLEEIDDQLNHLLEQTEHHLYWTYGTFIVCHFLFCIAKMLLVIARRDA